MGHILIVDDKAENRYLLRAFLQAKGFTICEAENGADALKVAGQEAPELIISDLLMPGMDGFKLLRAWKAAPELSEAPFMVYTATYTDPKDEQLARDLGADAFVIKPCDLDELLARVNELLERRQGGASPTAPAPGIHDEARMLRQYNEVLIRKLEEKVELLEQTNSTLQEEIQGHLQAQKDLQRVGDLLRAVSDGTTDAVFVKDTAGRYLLCNPAAARFMGRSQEDILGQTDAEFFDSVSARTVMENDQQVMHSGQVQTSEEVLTAAGATRTFLATKGPYYGADGSVSGLIGVSRDISDRKRLEEQLHHAQKMEAVGRLAGGVAHDFNNLLSVIMGYTELVIEEMAPGEPLRDDILAAHLAAERATALTRQLLAFSRREIIKPQVLELDALLSTALGLFQRLIGEDISLHALPEAAGGRILADPGQLEQVILNLAINARDAMPQGGSMTIRSTLVRVDDAYIGSNLSVPPGHYVQLSITDTGCGMDAATISRIFEPFFTTKGAGYGTGLGLATVHGIVQQCGGHISVYSEVGMGTTFKILFPQTDASAQAEEAGQPSSTANGTGTILLVEDDAALRDLISRMLKKCGYHLLSCSNGGEALRIAEDATGKIDLLLTDVVMPTLSGRELAERLRSVRPGIPVLYMSGFTDDAIVRHGVSHDAVEFIGKPFTGPQLTRKIQEILNKPERAPQ